jgi:hypothetical protein
MADNGVHDQDYAEARVLDHRQVIQRTWRDVVEACTSFPVPFAVRRFPTLS